MKVRDKDGGETEYRRTLRTVNHVPSIYLYGYSQATGSGVLELYSVDYGGAADGPYRVRVTWGDGQTTEVQQTEPGRLYVERAAYPPGTYTIQATVWDRDGASGSSNAVTYTIR